MTYCVAVAIGKGLVFASDSRTNAGIDQVSTYSKMHTFGVAGERQFVLLSAGNLATTQAVVTKIRRDIDNNIKGNLLTLHHLSDAAEYLGEINRAQQKKGIFAQTAESVYSEDYPVKSCWTGVLVGVALVLDYTAWFVDWDLILYDLHMQSWSQTPSEDIVFVAIDEPSLGELGRWPWSRRIHARLLDKLSQAGARVVGVNLILSEPDRDDPDADLSLAHAMKRNGRVILPVLPESTTPNGRLKETKPLPAFIDVVAGLGHVQTS